MFSGLLDNLKTDDEVAGVLAHEIGHCAARHTVKKFQAALGCNFPGRLVFSQLGNNTKVQKVAALSTNTAMQLVFSSCIRKDEFESDRLGIKYMNLAGYDPRGMMRVLAVLQAASKGRGAPLMLRSHPYLRDRITAARKETEEIKK